MHFWLTWRGGRHGPDSCMIRHVGEGMRQYNLATGLVDQGLQALRSHVPCMCCGTSVSCMQTDSFHHIYITKELITFEYLQLSVSPQDTCDVQYFLDNSD